MPAPEYVNRPERGQKLDRALELALRIEVGSVVTFSALPRLVSDCRPPPLFLSLRFGQRRRDQRRCIFRPTDPHDTARVPHPVVPAVGFDADGSKEPLFIGEIEFMPPHRQVVEGVRDLDAPSLRLISSQSGCARASSRKGTAPVPRPQADPPHPDAAGHPTEIAAPRGQAGCDRSPFTPPTTGSGRPSRPPVRAHRPCGGGR